MKALTLKRKKSVQTYVKKVFIPFSLFLILKNTSVTILLAQTPLTGPGAQWIKEYWYDASNTISESSSGEDWFYDLEQEKDGAGIVTGYVCAGYSSIVNYSTPAACLDYAHTPDPLGLEREGYLNAYRFPKLVELDAKGSQEWYKVYNSFHDQFRKVIQISGGYLAIGGITFECDPPICNPKIVDGAEIFEVLPDIDKKYTMLYVIKADDEGNLIKSAVYSLALPDSFQKYSSSGYDIEEDDDGNFVFCGYTDISNLPTSEKRTVAYVGKIDINLDILWQNAYLNDGVQISYSECILPHDGDYYLAASKATLPSPATYAAAPPESSRIHIIRINHTTGVPYSDFVIDASVDPDIAGFLSYPYYPSCTGCPANEQFNDCTAHGMIFNNGDLLVSATINRRSWYQDTGLRGIGKVYRIDYACGDPTCCYPVEVGEFQSFDLRMGITNTSDGGYAVVSSYHVADLYPPTTDENDTHTIEYFPGVTANFPYDNDAVPDGNTRYWNSDAYVAKFNASDVKMWEATYPKTANFGSYFPNDIKKEECLYHIVEAPDKGLVVGGNSSTNFDDDLAIKIYNDCSLYTSFAGIDDIANGKTINTNTTWSTSRKVRGVIIVKSGKTLTINGGAVIQFADSKAANYPTYILVRRGGRLIIEGGATLTGIEDANCSTMWEGVYVEGTYGVSQPTPATLVANGYTVPGAAHGLVKITGSANIKNARAGITLGVPASIEAYPDYCGGIIVADGANFINNTIDVSFLPFDKSNVSFMRHCNFSTTALLKDAIEVPVSHVKLMQVKNVTMRGNHFENTTSTTVYSGVDRGVGILGLNATFIVNDNPNAFSLGGPTTGDPNYFTNMHYGLYATQYAPATDNIVADGNIYNSNTRGIYLGGTTLAEANRNTITIPDNGKNNYGMYLDGSTAYGVEENNFTGPGADHIASISGLIVNQSGTYTNIIYRNTFSNLKYGIKIQGNNGDSISGLVIKCNDLSANKNDIAVITSGAVTASVNGNQGFCTSSSSAANNLFSDPTTVGMQLLGGNDVSDILYTWNTDPFPALHRVTPATSKTAQPPFDLYPVGPLFTGCTVFPFDQDKWATDYCPTNFTTGGSGRLANPATAGKRSIENSLIFNPYAHFVKEGGEAYEAHEQFIADISRNMLAGYYMEMDYTDSLQIMVDDDAGMLAQSIAAGLAVDTGGYVEAANIVDEITEIDSVQEQGYSSVIQTIAVSLAADTLTWLEMQELEIISVDSLAKQIDREGVQAKLIMEMLSNVNYEEPIYEPDDEIAEDDLRQIQDEFLNSEPNTIKIYPHPVKGSSIVQINLEFLTGNDMFIITDITGKKVAQYTLSDNNSYIKLSNKLLSPGMYIGFVQCDGYTPVSQQIVVIK